MIDGRCLNCLSFKHQVASCYQPSWCLRCHGLRHRAKDCLRPRRPQLHSAQARLDDRVAPAGFRHDHPPISDDRSLPTTAATGGGLDLTLSATDALVVVALATTKSAIMDVLRIGEDDFTLRPTFPELFVAIFRSQEF